MKTKFILSAGCLALCMSALTLPGNVAHAQQELGSLVYYDVPESEYREHANEWRRFLEYTLHREQCQHYVEPPAGYVLRGCQVYRVETAAAAATITETTTQTAEAATPPPAPTPASYTVYFGVDKSRVPGDEKEFINQVARDIQQTSPSSVNVSGYASTTGAQDHNQRLSEKRASSVANALTAAGVNANTISQQAYGETHLAVQTGDEVENSANRRVLVEFNH